MARMLVLAMLALSATPAYADGGADAERCRHEVFGDRIEFSGRIAGDIDAAIDYCTRAIQSGTLADPALAAVFHSRGLAHGAAGRYAGALKDFDAAIKLDPNHARAYFARATTYARINQVDSAIADFDRSIELDPNYTLAYASRGTSYRLLGRYDRAIADYDEAIRRNPDDPSGYESRGRTEYMSGKFAAAADDLAAAVQRAPGDHYPVLWLYLARLRAGSKGLSELRNSERLSLDEWPGAVVRMYLGDITPTAAAAAANHSDAAIHKSQRCELDFYFAQLLIVRERDRADEIVKFLRKAVDGCPHDLMEYTGAIAELDRLGK